MQEVTVYLGDRQLRNLETSCVASVPMHIVDRTDLEGGTKLFVHFDREQQAVIYRTKERDLMTKSDVGGEVFLGSYTLRRLDDSSHVVTVPREVVTYTGLEIGTSLGVYWDPAESALLYKLEADDNPFTRLAPDPENEADYSSSGESGVSDDSSESSETTPSKPQ